MPEREPAIPSSMAGTSGGCVAGKEGLQWRKSASHGQYGGGNYKQKNPRMLKPGDKACITNNNFLLDHHKGGFFQRYLGRVKFIVAF